MTPILFASLGGAITYYAGIINVALEGLMLSGAFAAVTFSYIYGNAFAGILAAVIVAVLFSLLYSFFVTTLNTNNFAIGFALNIFISSLTLYLTRIMFPGKNAFNSPQIQVIPNLSFDLHFDILNDLFMDFSILVYLAIILVFVMVYFIFKTPFGLWLRATGNRPKAVTTAGKHVSLIQYIASILTGVFCGLAGAQLSLSNVVLFSRDMSGGRGFMALAVILISRGNPNITIVLAVMFGLFDALSLQLQSNFIPSQFLFMLPYLMAIGTLIFINLFKSKKLLQER
jgi:simple sugar transport system permease protein